MKMVNILRKQIFVLCLVSVGVKAAYSQGVKAYSYTEINKFSTRLGTALGFETNNSIEFGAFYQVSLGKSNESRPKHEYKFVGGYLAMPFVSNQNFNLKFKVRVGMVNRENFVITPSLDAQFYLNKFIGLGLGVGTRNLNPTVMTSIILKAGNSPKRKSRYSKRPYSRLIF